MRTTTTTAAAVLLVALTVTAPARAEDGAERVGGGGAFINGSARTPQLPCRPPQDGGACAGTWHGVYTGTFSGKQAVDGDRFVPWWVVVESPGDATLAYAGEEPANACAPAVVRGVGSFAGGVEQVYGFYDTGALLPRAVAGIRMTIGFEWRRDGAAGPLAVTSLRMELDVYGVGTVTVIDESQRVSVADTAAAFVPYERGACVTSTPEVLDGVLSGTLSGIAVSAN